MWQTEMLIEKGVRIENPDSNEIGAEVNIERISGDGVVIYAGCKIFGEDTLVLRGSKLGYESPVTVDNCQIGPDVELKGGFFQKATFLANAKAGLGSHVREATILEEQASIAHTVALKHTILFPFVTLGSLINFCDCLMAGGTSRKNHSEVGSSYIHFNFTPSQDKATASLIGDVPMGVMLNQNPIFLGGQGGLVGPCRLGYGITVAAGTIVRKDELRCDRLIFGGEGKGGNVAFTANKFRIDKRVIRNNIIYIANLITLKQWYHQVRRLFVSEHFPEDLLYGLIDKVTLAIAERLNRLEAICQKASKDSEGRGDYDPERISPALQFGQELNQRWTELKNLFLEQQANQGHQELRDKFAEKIVRQISRCGRDYVAVIQSLDRQDSEMGTRWLQGIIDEIVGESHRIVPSIS